MPKADEDTINIKDTSKTGVFWGITGIDAAADLHTQSKGYESSVDRAS